MTGVIEYAPTSWNPIAMRCTPVSEGCAHCWHLAMANRLAGNKRLPADMRAAYAEKRPPVLVPDRLEQPMKWRKPRRVAVSFMGDLFHDDVPMEAISNIFGMMHTARQHTFLVLTKRPRRMQEFIKLWQDPHWRGNAAGDAWPREYPHVQLGVSCENQKAADERIPILLQIPAAVKWVSLEPLIGPVDLLQSINKLDWLDPANWKPGGLDWVVCGGESGPGARPMYPGWVRFIRDQCRVAGVPLWFKQHGDWLHESQGLKKAVPGLHEWSNGTWSYRVGKKVAGNLLDGKRWEQMP